MTKTYTVEAKPYEFEFNTENTSVIIIDMQRDFLYPGGFGEELGNDVSTTNKIIPTVQKLLEKAREEDMLVIHTREGHRPDLADLVESKKRGGNIGKEGPMGRILVRGEYGHDIVDELTPIVGEVILDKPGKGAFYQTDLDLILKSNNIQNLIVMGVTTHVCVQSTIREANDRGYECLMVEDGCAAFDPADHEDSIRMINQQGAIFGWTTPSKNIIDALEN